VQEEMGMYSNFLPPGIFSNISKRHFKISTRLFAFRLLTVTNSCEDGNEHSGPRRRGDVSTERQLASKNSAPRG
jgi:hypothetical protein